jgi:predicted cupin superfamily sugar epimerase
MGAHRVLTLPSLLFITVVHCCSGGWVNAIPEPAQRWVESLSLEHQNFGNFLGITYNSQYQVEHLPSNFKGGQRMLHGEIYNLFAFNGSNPTLSQGGFPLHMLEGDETYHYYAGDGALTLFEFDFDTRTVKNISIGATSPGIDVPRDSHMAIENATQMNAFYKLFPNHKNLIERLTSF